MTSQIQRIEIEGSIWAVRTEARRAIRHHIPTRYMKAWPRYDLPIDWTKNFYISSTTGVGKTWALYGLLKHFIIRDEMLLASKVYYEGEDKPRYVIPGEMAVMNISNVMSKLRYCEIGDRLGQIERLCKVKRLLLDDMGSEMRSESGFSDDVIYQVVESRYTHGLYTGFTSNFKVSNLPYDDRIRSRIMGLVGKNGIILEGRDRRVQP